MQVVKVSKRRKGDRQRVSTRVAQQLKIQFEMTRFPSLSIKKIGPLSRAQFAIHRNLEEIDIVQTNTKLLELVGHVVSTSFILYEQKVSGLLS